MKRLSYNFNQKYLVFDFETECLSLTNNKPWELAFAVYEGNKLLYSRCEYLWWPDLNISDGAAKITRFNYEQYKSIAVDPEPVFDEFESLIRDPSNLAVAHNGISFDLPVYRLWAKNYNKWIGWGDIPSRFLDTMLLSRIYNDERKPEKDLFCSQIKEIGRPARGSKKANLGSMAKFLGIEVDESQQHGALYDISLTSKVLNELIYKLEL